MNFSTLLSAAVAIGGSFGVALFALFVSLVKRDRDQNKSHSEDTEKILTALSGLLLEVATQRQEVHEGFESIKERIADVEGRVARLEAGR